MTDEKDGWEHILDAIKLVDKAPYGVGEVVCPKCGGKLHYSKNKGRRGDSVRAKCETLDCLEFMS